MLYLPWSENKANLSALAQLKDKLLAFGSGTILSRAVANADQGEIAERKLEPFLFPCFKFLLLY